MVTTNDSFGAVLKKIRKDRQMTQKMLAQDICSQSVLSRIENDEEVPNVLVMQQLCRKLGVTMDYVLSLHSEDVSRIHQLLEELAYYFYHKQYEQLFTLLKDQDLLGQLYIDTDLQMYYYYLGSCEYFLNKNYELAINYLNRGLSYTLKGDKSYYSSNEIQIISCIGRIYDDLGQQERAKEELERSIQLFAALPRERVNCYLAKVFYNYARYLDGQGEYQQALSVAQQGVAMVHQQTSYYYLEELFALIGTIYAASASEEKAQEYIEASQAVKKVLATGNGVDLS